MANDGHPPKPQPASQKDILHTVIQSMAIPKASFSSNFPAFPESICYKINSLLRILYGDYRPIFLEKMTQVFG